MGSKLVLVEKEEDWITGEITAIKSVKLNDSQVLQDYWDHLSYKAVESGVALLDLFFREVEKERKTGELAQLNMSYSEAKSEVGRFLNFAKGVKSRMLFATVGDASYVFFQLNPGGYEKFRAILKLRDKYYKKLLVDNERNEITIALAEYEKAEGKTQKKNLASALNAFNEDELPTTVNALASKGKAGGKTKNDSVKPANVSGANKNQKSDTEAKLKQQNKSSEPKPKKTKPAERKLPLGENEGGGAPRQPPTQIQSKKQESNQNKNIDNEKSSRSYSKQSPVSAQDDFNNRYKFLAIAKRSGAFVPGAFAYGAGSSGSKSKKLQIAKEYSGASEDVNEPTNTRQVIKPEVSFIDLPTLVTDATLAVKGQSINASTTTVSLGSFTRQTNNQNWSFEIPLKEGENIITVKAENDAMSTNISGVVFLDSLPSITFEMNCLACEDNLCYVLPDSLNELKIYTSEDTDVFKVNGVLQNTLATSSDILLSVGESVTFTALAKDEHTEVSKELKIQAYLPKLRINEYLPHRKSASSLGIDAGWIEIYNPENFEVDLNAWTLEATQKYHKKIELSGKIPSKSFYIIELGNVYTIENLNSDKLSLTDRGYLDNLFFEPDKTLKLSYNGILVDEAPVYTPSEYRFQSFERGNKASLSEHSCSLKAPIAIKINKTQKSIDNEFLCQSLAMQNENTYYLNLEALADGRESLKEDAIYIIPHALILPKEKTLRLDKPVVLKFAKGFDTNTYGALIIQGNLALDSGGAGRIILTSASDNSAGVVVQGYINGTNSANVVNEINVSQDASFVAKGVSFRNFASDKILSADEASLIELSNIIVKESKISREGTAFALKADYVSIEDSDMSLDVDTVFRIIANRLDFKNNKITNGAAYALRFSVVDMLNIENNNFGASGDTDIMAMKFAKTNLIKNNLGAQDFVSVTDSSFANVNSFIYENNDQLSLYFPDILHLNDIELFKTQNTKLNFDTDARIFAERVKDFSMSDFELTVANGGFIFKDSIVHIANAYISVKGNLNASTAQQGKSAGLSFINSKAKITDTKFEDNDKASIYAEDSEIILDNVNFTGDYPDLENINSQIIKP